MATPRTKEQQDAMLRALSERGDELLEMDARLKNEEALSTQYWNSCMELRKKLFHLQLLAFPALGLSLYLLFTDVISTY